MSPPSPDSSSHPGRLLVVMRHGRAEAFADEDHRRRLTDRGRHDVTAASAWLAGQHIVPTHAYVSSAVRTRDSWDAFVEGSACSVRPQVEDAVYTADADSAVDILRTAPADAQVVLYLGHNPTAASLAHLLDGGDPDPDAFRLLSTGFPASAVAVLEIGVPWVDLAEATGRLVAFHAGGA